MMRIRRDHQLGRQRGQAPTSNQRTPCIVRRPPTRKSVWGQAMIEYLVIAVTIISFAIALSPLLVSRVNALLGQTRDQLINPAGNADSFIPGVLFHD